MDPDDNADVFAILGLAGAGLGLMIVGTLDLMGAAVVLAVCIPSLVAIVTAVGVAAMHWHQTVRGSVSRPETGGYTRWAQQRPFAVPRQSTVRSGHDV